MLVTDFTRRRLAEERNSRIINSEKTDLEKQGYIRHKQDLRLNNGDLIEQIITDVKISCCGKYLYIKTDYPSEEFISKWHHD